MSNSQIKPKLIQKPDMPNIYLQEQRERQSSQHSKEPSNNLKSNLNQECWDDDQVFDSDLDNQQKF